MSNDFVRNYIAWGAGTVGQMMRCVAKYCGAHPMGSAPFPVKVDVDDGSKSGHCDWLPKSVSDYC
jgi:hypothetical protein